MELEVLLPYFKQGDDLSHFLSAYCKQEAFKQHARMLKATGEFLEQLSECVTEDMEIHADTHWISINCEENVGRHLLELFPDFLSEVVWDDEEDNDFDVEEGYSTSDFGTKPK